MNQFTYWLKTEEGRFDEWMIKICEYKVGSHTCWVCKEMFVSESLYKKSWHTNFHWKWIRVILVKFGSLLSFNSFTYFLSGIFVWVNYNCYLMESHTFWRHKGQHICVSKLPLSLDKLPYQLKTQGQHIWISGLQSWTELLTIWRHKGSIFELINYNDYLMDSLTIWNTRTGYLD